MSKPFLCQFAVAQEGLPQNPSSYDVDDETLKDYPEVLLTRRSLQMQRAIPPAMNPPIANFRSWF